MKNIVLLGSTGSIGENTLRVVEKLSARFRIVGLAVNRNYKRALAQAEQFHVRHVAVSDPEAARLCKSKAGARIKIHSGAAGVAELAALDKADIVVCALVGIAGLKPVMAALTAGKRVALATKEVLVAAGAIVTDACSLHHAALTPVDSEHSAVFQCLEGLPPVPGKRRSETIRRIALTASGGPFGMLPDVDLDKVTVKQALNHPKWNMGKKVTVDSATLMNKGLEIMEARWLFDVATERIEVLLHPECIVHSLVEFIDGNMIAQLSVPDMRFAIQYALTYPERLDGKLPRLDLAKHGSLHFSAPDPIRFPALTLADAAARRGGTMPAVLNAANEAAVQDFLKGRIRFSGIWRLVDRVMQAHDVIDDPNIDEIIEADAWARSKAASIKPRISL